MVAYWRVLKDKGGHGGSLGLRSQEPHALGVCIAGSIALRSHRIYHQTAPEDATPEKRDGSKLDVV